MIWPRPSASYTSQPASGDPRPRSSRAGAVGVEAAPCARRSMIAPGGGRRRERDRDRRDRPRARRRARPASPADLAISVASRFGIEQRNEIARRLLGEERSSELPKPFAFLLFGQACSITRRYSATAPGLSPPVRASSACPSRPTRLSGSSASASHSVESPSSGVRAARSACSASRRRTHDLWNLGTAGQEQYRTRLSVFDEPVRRARSSS